MIPMRAQSLPFLQPLSLQFPAIGEQDSVMLHIHLNNAPDYQIRSVMSRSAHLTSKSLGRESVEVDEMSIVFTGRSTTSRPQKRFSNVKRPILAEAYTSSCSERHYLQDQSTFARRMTDSGILPNHWPFQFTFPQDGRRAQPGNSQVPLDYNVDLL